MKVAPLFGARTADDLYDFGLMKCWETKHQNFACKPTPTRDHDEGMLHGRIPEVLGKQFLDLSKHSIFVADRPSS